ncbi:T9SS type A sorting domain-containing protein [bacterium]|nr:T9SS type A sorting domain-containing protein [bacterium]
MNTRLLFLLFVVSSGFTISTYSQNYFTPVEPTGRPYAIVISEAYVDDVLLEEGDEIGLFDGDLCVGAIVLNDFPAPATAWEYDPANELSGFTDGNPILYRVWDDSEDLEVGADGTILNGHGNGAFGFGPYTEVALSATTTPTLAYYPYALSFRADIGETIEKSLLIYSIGSEDLIIESATLEDHPDFSFEIITDLTLTPFSSDTLVVSFTPSAPGTATSNLIIENNDPNEANLVIPLFGEGIGETSVANDHTPSDSYEIGNAWPNPFNSTCKISVSVDEPVFVKMQIVNILGESISHSSKHLLPGNQQLEINGYGFHTGLYFLHMNVENKRYVKKLLYLQ